MADPVILSGSAIRGNLSSRFFNIRAVSDNIHTSSVSASIGFYSDNPHQAFGQGMLGTELFSTRRGNYGTLQKVGYIADMNVGNSDGTPGTGMHMAFGASKNSTEGYSNDACLQLDYPGFWRFRWVVKSGTRTITISTKQNSTGSFRPSMVIKANPSIGVTQDISGSAPNGVGWVTIGPLTVTPTTPGPLWVELHNNQTCWPTNPTGSMIGQCEWPTLFDHIITT